MLLPNSSEIHVEYFSTANDVLSAYVDGSFRDIYLDIKGINFAILTQHEASYTIRTSLQNIIRKPKIYRESGKLLRVNNNIYIVLLIVLLIAYP